MLRSHIGAICATVRTSDQLVTSGRGSTAMTGAQFEISIDSVPRSYRDRKDYAPPTSRLKQ